MQTLLTPSSATVLGYDFPGQTSTDKHKQDSPAPCVSLAQASGVLVKPGPPPGCGVMQDVGIDAQEGFKEFGNFLVLQQVPSAGKGGLSI